MRSGFSMGSFLFAMFSSITRKFIKEIILSRRCYALSIQTALLPRENLIFQCRFLPSLFPFSLLPLFLPSCTDSRYLVRRARITRNSANNKLAESTFCRYNFSQLALQRTSPTKRADSTYPTFSRVEKVKFMNGHNISDIGDISRV